VYKRTRSARGFIAGEPRKYAPGHGGAARWANHVSHFVEQVGPLKTPCHVWQRTIGAAGYGELVVRGVKHLAHRWFFEQSFGVIPSGYVLHHRCENKRCVNPTHLKPLRRADHLLRHQAAKLFGAAAL